MLTMYDSIDISQVPGDAEAVAGYVNGHWPTYSSLAGAFPRALRLSIAVSADADADCLDVEAGNATIAQVPGWLARQAARGVWRPCVYASASVMGGVLGAVQVAGRSLSAYRYWSAHYGAGEHICGQNTCGLVHRTMDGTQWTSRALGRNLDQSLLDDNFFRWEDVLMTTIPVVQKGSTGQAVKNWQGLLIAHGYSPGSSGPGKDGVDGVFGVQTDAVTRSFQKAKGLTVDGIAGQQSWTAALSS